MTAAVETPVAARPNQRQAAKSRTRTKVVEAAYNLFETAGYEAANIRRIAKLAGLSTGAVFANFRDKADLYQTVYDHPPLTAEDGRVMAAMLAALLGPRLPAALAGMESALSDAARQALLEQARLIALDQESAA